MDVTAVPIPVHDRPARPDERGRFYGTFFKVAPAMFIGALDQTIVATALPAIGKTLHSLDGVTWVMTAYLLAATVTAPIFGRMGDAVGRKSMLLVAVAAVFVGSLACALAPSLPWLIVARAIQGAGGGGLMTLSQALIGAAVSPRERGRFQGWFGALFALASTVGPVAGGGLSEVFGWRAVFWINVPLAVLAGLAAVFVPEERTQGRFQLDIVGTTLFVASTVGLLMILSGDSRQSWIGSHLPLAGAAVVVGYFVLWFVEHRSSHPLIDVKFLGRPIVWRTALCVFLNSAALFGAVIQLPLFLQSQLGVAPGRSGMVLLPLTLAQVVMSTFVGYRIAKTGLPRPPLIVGLAAAGLGFAAFCAALQFGGIAIFCTSIVFGLGLGATMPAAQILVQTEAGVAALGEATALISFTRAVGGVAGVAICAAVLEFASAQGAVGFGSGEVASGRVPFQWVFGVLAGLVFVAAGVALSLPKVKIADLAGENGA
jgi:EmrB/QacA subfamily drug resistance transporter